MSSNQTTQLDRIPPHSVEGEQGVLGCILLSPNDCLNDCISYLPCSDAFYDLKHRAIYEVILDMQGGNEPIDPITLQTVLKNRQQLDEVGGLAYIASLPDAVPSAANLEYYLRIVKDKYILRKAIQTCTDAVARIYEHEGDVDGIMDSIERQILEINSQRSTINELPTIKELVGKSIDNIEKMQQAQGGVIGLPTGFVDLDRITRGLKGGELFIIAARPSVGKTSCAMNIAEHIAVDCQLPVGVFSLEMSSVSLVTRMLCSRARVNLQQIGNGFLCERDFPKLTSAAGKLMTSNLHLDDISGITILKLKSRARKMFQKFGIRLFIIDYLQLLRGDRKANSRNDEITDISNGLKGLAKELNVPVLVLSQLNRDMEHDKNRKPRLSDLRDGGAIEQDADVIGFLWRKPAEESNPDAEEITLSIAKQRNGPIGDIPLVFFKQYTRFESAAKVSQQDLPE